VKINYVSPDILPMPEDLVAEVGEAGIPQHATPDLGEVLGDTDVLYVTRIQKERFESLAEYDLVKDSYVITPDTLTAAKQNMIVMHPLPRVGEISSDVDKDPRAAYFRQMEYGMYVRMALLALVLGRA
jgi:aspartate carbamoyltransferase catalytic subunit